MTRWVTNGMLVARKQRYRPVCHHPHRGDLVLLVSLVRTFLRELGGIVQSIFANAADQETDADAAIPPKPGPPGTRSLCAWRGKNGRT